MTTRSAPRLAMAVMVGLAACHSTALHVAPPTSAPPPTPAFKIDGVATWRGDATAAYSLIHDDICNPDTVGVLTAAEPELARRGLHAGFGVIVSSCDSPNGGTWEQVRTLIAHGHDVFSHSWDHPCMTNDKGLAESCDPKAPHSIDFVKEIGQAAAQLKSSAGVAPDFFIFPYDVCDPAAITYLKHSGFLGARCGTLGVNGADFRDTFGINFDVFGPSYSNYFGTPACGKTSQGAAPVQFTTLPADYNDECRQYVLNHYVDEAIAKKGWAVRELHGVDRIDVKGWELVALPDYRAHLDYLLTQIQSGALWVDGPTTILKYRVAREACPLPTVVGKNTLRFAPPSSECQRYATALSYRLASADGSDVAAPKVRQGARSWPARRISAGHYVVDADPSLGDATLE